MTGDLRARVPSVSSLLEHPTTRALVQEHGHATVVGALRQRLAEVRAAIEDGGAVPDAGEVAIEVGRALDRGLRRRTRGVVNATGVVLHTNLGRAPLAEAAVQAMCDAAGASTVEYDLETRSRSGRGRHAGGLLASLVGSEDALVVNNGAAGLVLALAALAGGGRVAVSRGELVEIGGSFRLPAIIEAAGVDLVEVGTTNRTRARDYADAIAADPGIAAILRVHPSNFTIEGFTARPTAADLVAVARGAGVRLVHDVGSGLLHDRLPLPAGTEEPSMATAVGEGADLVVASGDKLLGGPQAGLLVGAGGAVEACRRHPLARALRVDKVRLAALEATLEAYRRDAAAELPTWAALTCSTDELRARAEAIAATAPAGLELRVVPLDAVVGGGTLPGTTVPSVGLALAGRADTLADRLGRMDPPVVGRVHDGVLVLDLRTVAPAQDDHLATALRALAG